MKKLLLNQKTGILYEDLDSYIYNLRIYSNKFIIFPSYIYLKEFIESNFIVGSQDIAQSDVKNQTGEITGKQLKNIGVRSVIIGHSERRKNQKETKETLISKFNNALENELGIVYCVGESLVDYRLKETTGVIIKQLDEVFNNIDIKKIRNLSIAYEPVWAIGSGSTPTNFEISNVLKTIKEYLEDKGINASTLYGGSVSDENIENLSSIKEVDGFLVGGASNDYKKVIKMCEILINSTK